MNEFQSDANRLRGRLQGCCRVSFDVHSVAFSDVHHCMIIRPSTSSMLFGTEAEMVKTLLMVVDCSAAASGRPGYRWCCTFTVELAVTPLMLNTTDYVVNKCQPNTVTQA